MRVAIRSVDIRVNMAAPHAHRASDPSSAHRSVFIRLLRESDLKSNQVKESSLCSLGDVVDNHGFARVRMSCVHVGSFKDAKALVHELFPAMKQFSNCLILPNGQNLVPTIDHVNYFGHTTVIVDTKVPYPLAPNDIQQVRSAIRLALFPGGLMPASYDFPSHFAVGGLDWQP
jgi:hypothetical protein